MNTDFKLRFAIIIIMLIATTIDSVSQEKITLEQALKAALENNYSIQIVRNTKKIADNNVNIGNAGMLPKIDASAGYNYSKSDIEMLIAAGGQPQTIKQTGNTTQTTNASVNLNWTLFDGFAMFISFNKFQELRDKSNIELQLMIENMYRNIINTYFEALKLQEKLKILRENLEISQDRLSRINDKSEFGAALKIEVYRAEVDLNIDSSAFLQTKIAYENLIRNFNYLIGNDIKQDIYFDNDIDINDNLSYKELMESTLNRNSSINKALKEKSISELDYEMVNSAYYPRINFSSAYSYSNQENDAGFMLKNQSNGFNIGFNASMNLWDGNRTSIQSQNAKVNLLINEIKYQDIKKQIELNFQNAYNNYLQKFDILGLEQENLKTSELNFERSRDLYELGQITAIEFRDAQVNLMNAKNRINAAKYALKVAESELLLISGRYIN